MSYTGIAISGKAGSGKSTLAHELAATLPSPRRQDFPFVLPLAGALKADLAALGVQKGQPWAREMMIAYGQNRRALRPDYWIARWEDAVAHTQGLPVVDDVRFRNELRYFEERGFLTVRLVAPELLRAERLGLDPDDPFLTTDDASESELDDEPFGLILSSMMPVTTLAYITSQVLRPEAAIA